jgi:leucyl-tRNA synthetase
MFMGPYEMGGDWSDKGISGTDRFVQRTYELFNRFPQIMEKTAAKSTYDIGLLKEEEKIVYRKVNQTIKKFDEEIENFRFNTAIAFLMELLNELVKSLDKCSPEIQSYALERYGILVSPVAPHLAEECLQIIGRNDSIFKSPVWYNADPEALIEDKVNFAVQVNGKLRATIEMPINSAQEEVKKGVMVEDKVLKYLEGKAIVKEIFVKNKIYNIVVK